MVNRRGTIASQAPHGFSVLVLLEKVFTADAIRAWVARAQAPRFTQIGNRKIFFALRKANRCSLNIGFAQFGIDSQGGCDVSLSARNIAAHFFHVCACQ